MAVQQLGIYAFSAEGAVSIPGQGTKIQHATQHGQKKKKKIRVLLMVLTEGTLGCQSWAGLHLQIVVNQLQGWVERHA